MVKRRKVGPAFERSPAKRVSEWYSKNTLIFMAGLIAAVVFWFGMDILVDRFLNFLVSGGDDSKENMFSSNDTKWIITKIVGSLVLFFAIAKSAKK
jgi:hypothetical protein